MSAHVYLEHESGKGGNNVASLLWKEFEAQGLLSSTLGPPAAEINLFFDNCGGQNKNRMVLRLLLYYMVKRNLTKKVTAYFLVRGHTKNDCDHLFNLMKKTVRRRNIYTPRDLYLALDDHQDIDAIPVEEAPFQNWDELQDKFMRRPLGVKSAHVFTVDDVDSNLFWIQDFVGSDKAAVSHNLVKPAFRTTAWYEEEPNDMPMKGMPHIKHMELFDKWRPLVPIDKCLEWEFLHTDLAKEHRDSVKQQTKASKKQRLERGRDAGDNNNKKKKDEEATGTGGKSAVV